MDKERYIGQLDALGLDSGDAVEAAVERIQTVDQDTIQNRQRRVMILPPGELPAAEPRRVWRGVLAAVVSAAAVLAILVPLWLVNMPAPAATSSEAQPSSDEAPPPDAVSSEIPPDTAPSETLPDIIPLSEPITDIIWLEPPKDAEYCQILHVDDTHALVGESETSIGTTHPPEVYHYYTPDGLQWSYKPPVLFYDWDIYPLKNDSYALVGRDHESNIEHIILLDRQGNATRQPGWPYSRNDRVTPDEDDGLYVFAQRYNLSKNLITLLHITPRGIEEETPLIFPADPEFSISGSYWESGGTGIADGSGGFYLSTYLEYHDSSASFTRLLHIDANRSVSMKISIEKYSFGDSAFVTEKGNLRCVLTVAEEQHTLLEFDAGCHVVYEKDVDIEKYVYMIHPHGNIFIGVSGCGSANTPIQLLRIDEKGEVFEISFDFKDHVMTDSNHVHPEFVELDDGFILIYDVWEFDNERHFIHVERYDDYLRLRSCATFGDSEDTKYLLGKIHESGITRSGILWALE